MSIHSLGFRLGFYRAYPGLTDYDADHEEDYNERTTKKRNDYLSYLLSETILDSKQNISTRKTNKGQPIVFISYMDSENDITKMVHQLLSENEFSDASSIFLVVPTSDDNDSETSSDSSSICIQFKNCQKWNQKQCDIKNPGKLTFRMKSFQLVSP